MKRSLIILILALLILLACTYTSTLNNTNNNVASASPVTMYFRNSIQTVNGLTAYSLLTSPGGSTGGSIVYDSTALNYWYIGIRVFIRHSNGSETEITSGSPVAVETVFCDPDASGSVSYSGNDQWNCPQISLSLTDALVVRVYFSDGYTGSWYMPADTNGENLAFTTNQLGALQLNSVTLTAHYALAASHVSGVKNSASVSLLLVLERAIQIVAFQAFLPVLPQGDIRLLLLVLVAPTLLLTRQQGHTRLEAAQLI